MKRLIVVFFLLLAGSTGYLAYNGQIKTIAWRIRRFITDRQTTESGETNQKDSKSVIASKPGLFQRTHKIAVKNISDPNASLQEKVNSWKMLSDVYLHAGSNQRDRDLVLGPLTDFAQTHILSSDLYVHKDICDRVSVKRGNTLYSIARKHNTTITAIKYLNEIYKDTIFPGMNLKVPNNKIGLYVDKSECRFWGTYGGHFLFEMVCGIGKNNKTPTGTFVIKNRLKNPKWTRRGKPDIPAGDPRNELGCRWLGFKDTPTATGLGIHEAVNGVGLGEARSNGCIRLSRKDVELIYTLIPVGTPVIIRD